jgi:hypothetical protein
MTVADGIAVLHVPAPIPEQVFLNADNGRIRPCYSWGAFSSKEVIERWSSPRTSAIPRGSLKGNSLRSPAK